MMATPGSLPVHRFVGLYKSIVRSERFFYAVIGIMGLLGSYSGVSSLFLKQSEPWPGSLTLGVMAIIFAAQGLTGAPRVELMCSWRILITFYGLYQGIAFLAIRNDGLWFVAVKIALVSVVVWFYWTMWRRTHAGTGNLSGDGV